MNESGDKRPNRQRPWVIGDSPSPLYDWLIRVIHRVLSKGEMVTALSEMSGFSASVVRGSGPRRSKAMDRFLANVDASLGKRAMVFEDETIAYVDTLREVAGKEFTCFRFSPGTFDDLALRDLCGALDRLGNRLSGHTVLPPKTGEWLVELAGRSPAFPGDLPEPTSPERAALDVLLMLNARIDHVLWERHGRVRCYPQSQFTRLSPSTDASGAMRRPFHRLFDAFYGFHCVLRIGRMPSAKPTVLELDELFDGQPESGGQSHVVRWRNGHKQLRREDVKHLIARVSRDEGIQQLCSCMYMAAVLWELVLDEAPELLPWAKTRYSCWWAAGLASDAWSGLPPDPYWHLV